VFQGGKSTFIESFGPVFNLVEKKSNGFGDLILAALFLMEVFLVIKLEWKSW
jgi:hypothetical protein